jgi:hypothetical protein
VGDDMHQRHFAEANRHVAVGLAIVARQLDLINRLEKDGIDTLDARRLLDLLEETLGLMLAHQDLARRSCDHRHSN